MKVKFLISIFAASLLTGCSMFSNTDSSSDYAANGLAGTVIGAGVGAAIGSAISNGDVANSALLGGGVGLVVGVAGTYAYRKIKVRNEIISNDENIESNRRKILSGQADLDSMRAEAIEDSHSFEFDKSRTDQVYDGATLGNYYR